MLLPCFIHVLLQDAVHSSRSYQDPCGFCPWDPQADRILSVCCSKFDHHESIPLVVRPMMTMQETFSEDNLSTSRIQSLHHFLDEVFHDEDGSVSLKLENWTANIFLVQHQSKFTVQ